MGKLEEERKKKEVEEQARLEEEKRKKEAEEQARLDEERKKIEAEEQARLEEERKMKEAEEQDRLEEEREMKKAETELSNSFYNTNLHPQKKSKQKKKVIGSKKVTRLGKRGRSSFVNKVET